MPGYSITLVDSLGSGDAFSAGFIYKILRGASIQQACEFGNILGALVATQEGATYPITKEGLKVFLEQNHERNVDPDLKQFIFN